jgi:hypothetical protein
MTLCTSPEQHIGIKFQIEFRKPFGITRSGEEAFRLNLRGERRVITQSEITQ